MTDGEDVIKFEPKSLCIKITIYLIVLFVGAAVFMKLERANNDSTSGILQTTKLKQRLLDKYNVTLTELGELEAAFKQEISDKEEADRLSRWTYGNSVFFAFTIMTTIGETKYLSSINCYSYWSVID